MPVKFDVPQYNAVAKILRENFPGEYDRNFPAKQREKLLLQRGTVVNLALEFARYFQDNNDEFDPLKFLDHCSPDVDMYPLSELWEEV